MKKIIILGTLTALTLSTSTHAEEEQRKIKLEAIPPTISHDDPELKLTPEEQLRILNAKRSHRLVKDIKIGSTKMPDIPGQKLKRLQQEKFDKNPRQTIPYNECKKENNMIDNEVNECMNGRLKPYWKKS